MPRPTQLALPLLVSAFLIGCGEQEAPPPAELSEPAATNELEPPPPQFEPFVPSLEIETDDFEPEDGFTALTVEDFVPFEGRRDTWQEVEGVIVCSGEPKGYLHSRTPFGNFTLRGEYRFMPQDATAEPPPNTGFMIHIQEPHKIWPRSLEVQGRFDQMCSIKSNGGVPALTIEDDPAARESARKPVGEWNAVEIVSKDGALTATLNGQLICTSQPGELTEGLIGLQSELFEVHFRRLRIREDE